MLSLPGHFSLMFVILVHVLIAKTLAYATHSHTLVKLHQSFTTTIPPKNRNFNQNRTSFM